MSGAGNRPIERKETMMEALKAALKSNGGLALRDITFAYGVTRQAKIERKRSGRYTLSISGQVEFANVSLTELETRMRQFQLPVTGWE